MATLSVQTTNYKQLSSVAPLLCGSARLRVNSPRFTPFCILTCAFCVAHATLHYFQVDVLQGNALAWEILATVHLDGILGNGCASNVLEDNIADLHC